MFAVDSAFVLQRTYSSSQDATLRFSSAKLEDSCSQLPWPLKSVSVATAAKYRQLSTVRSSTTGS